MNELPGNDFSADELGAALPPSDAKGIEAIAEQLRSQRPRPRPGLRAATRAKLVALESSPRRWAPRRPLALAAAYAGSGLMLLVIAAVGLAGVGRLGAGVRSV